MGLTYKEKKLLRIMIRLQANNQRIWYSSREDRQDLWIKILDLFSDARSKLDKINKSSMMKIIDNHESWLSAEKKKYRDSLRKLKYMSDV